MPKALKDTPYFLTNAYRQRNWDNEGGLTPKSLWSGYGVANGTAHE